MNSRLRCFCQLGDLTGDAGFLSATRQHIHQHPELSFQEADTATQRMPLDEGSMLDGDDSELPRSDPPASAQPKT